MLESILIGVGVFLGGVLVIGGFGAFMSWKYGPNLIEWVEIKE